MAVLTKLLVKQRSTHNRSATISRLVMIARSILSLPFPTRLRMLRAHDGILHRALASTERQSNFGRVQGLPELQQYLPKTRLV